MRTPKECADGQDSITNPTTRHKQHHNNNNEYLCVQDPSDWECSSFSRNCFAVEPDLFTGVSEDVSSLLEEPHAGRLDIPDALKKGHLEVLHELKLEIVRGNQGEINDVLAR